MRNFFRIVPLLLIALALASLLGARRAQTLPQYAARTGLLCANCHFDPNGGGPRNEFGFNYGKNRHSLEPEPAEMPWGELALVNRVGENLPLYFSVNQRFMLLANQFDGQDSIARLGFFNMQNAIHLAFQPHSRLTLVYTLDAFSTGPFAGAYVPKEAFGMFAGLPFNGYLKAGRFRNPFGLRMDDHTVATRRGFTDFASNESFLPYDPRASDMGLEIGGEQSGIYGRAAWTTGQSEVLSGQYSGATSVKLGLNMPSWYQGGFSFYDDYRKENTSGEKRATRWGYYGLFHLQKFALIGEVAAGTDEAEPIVPGMVTGAKTNKFAYFAELDYTLLRQANLRVRMDHQELNRSSDQGTRDTNTHDRYAIEADYMPVPFAEMRWVIRFIDHKDNTGYGNPDETQSYLQFHFTY